MDRRPRLLIPETSPLSLLAVIGAEALDWLFVPGAEVWITDMVEEEIRREPLPGDDPRSFQRGVIDAWFAANKGRIAIQQTPRGEEYKRAMETWRLAGAPAGLKPKGRGAGERSILDVLDGIEASTAGDGPVIVMMDDRKGRAAVRLVEHLDIDLLATESFLAWLWQDFGIERAQNAWQAIARIQAGRVPSAPKEHPVHIRRS